MIWIEINGTNAIVRKNSTLTKGLVGATAEFRFDKEWDGLSKTAVFRQGDVVKDYLLIDDKAVIPWEVMQIVGVPVSIGVYGTKADGTVAIPTIWAKTAHVRDGADPSGDESSKPSPTVYEEILSAIDAGKLKGDKGDKGDPGKDGTMSFSDLTPEQKESLKGEKGVSGVYVGSGEMPEGYNVQIDPEGNSLTTLEDLVAAVIAALPVYNGEVVTE